jgi:hypothetical protein
MGYTYSRDGHLAAHSYPTGRSVDYAPNALGQPTRAGLYASSVTYYSNGAMAQFTYGNGVVHSLNQNVRGLPDRSLDAKGASIILDDGYDYDRNGNVQAISDGARAGRGNRDMTYDGLDRLTSTVSPMFGSAAYGYDVADNLRTVKANGRDHTYYYDPTWRLTNVLNSTGASVIGLSYDAQGNLANKNGQGFRFDFGNRLREAISRESYRYDGHGRRVRSKATGQADIASFYGQDGVLRHQRDHRRARAIDHIYLNGSLVARVSDEIAPFSPVLTVPGYNTSGSYTVQWSAVTGATGYELQEASNGGAWQVLYSGTALSQSVSGKSSANYAYRARACNTAGCGQWSTSATVAVQLPPSGAPTLSAPSLGASGNYSVSWTIASGAVSYRLEQSFNGGGWATVYDGGATGASFSNRPGGSDAYRVIGCNPAGCGGYSNTATVSVVYPPGTPTLTVPASNHGGSYTISWPATSGATYYLLDERFNGGSWTQIHNAGTTGLAVSSRSTGTYGYRVTACNAAGCSAVSAEASVQVLLPPPTPTISAPSSNATGSYTVSWSAATATSYNVEERSNGGGWALLYSGGNTSGSIAGRGTGTYDYRVRACNAAGCSGYSATATVSVTVPPSTPAIAFHHKHLIFYGQVVQGSCTVQWTTSAGASTYNLRVYQGGMAYSGSQTSVSGELWNLYCAPQLEIQACNAVGCSAWSSPPSQQTVTEERYEDGEVPP